MVAGRERAGRTKGRDVESGRTPTYPNAVAEHGNDCGAPRTLCLPLSQAQGDPIVASMKQDRYYMNMKLECRRHLSPGAVPPTERYEVLEGAHCSVATSSCGFAKRHIHVVQLGSYRTLV